MRHPRWVGRAAASDSGVHAPAKVSESHLPLHEGGGVVGVPVRRTRAFEYRERIKYVSTGSFSHFLQAFIEEKALPTSHAHSLATNKQRTAKNLVAYFLLGRVGDNRASMHGHHWLMEHAPASVGD